MGQLGQVSLRLKTISGRRGLTMDSRNPKIEELQALQESLELQRRQVLVLILEIQDSDSPEAIEVPRLKLAIINQELTRATIQISELKRREYMLFETPEKMQTIAEVLRESVSPAVKEAVQARDEAETKVQILKARAAKFEERKAELEGEIGQLNQEISRVLHEGGDPSEINRTLRAKSQASEDLATWAAELRKGAIPAVEKTLADATIALWSALLGAVNRVRPNFELELNDRLASASELSASWKRVVNNLFKEYRTGRGPSITAANLIVDQKRTSFLAGPAGVISPFGTRLQD